MRYLIADDEPLARYNIRRLLLEIDSHAWIEEVEHGRTLVQVLREKTFHGVFVDIRMPGIDGLTAINLLVQEGYTFPWVVLTSYPEFSYAKEALDLGACGYLLKPVERKDVEEACRRCFEQLKKIKKEHLQDLKKRWEYCLCSSGQKEKIPENPRICYIPLVLGGDLFSLAQVIEEYLSLQYDPDENLVMRINMEGYTLELIGEYRSEKGEENPPVRMAVKERLRLLLEKTGLPYYGLEGMVVLQFEEALEQFPSLEKNLFYAPLFPQRLFSWMTLRESLLPYGSRELEGAQFLYEGIIALKRRDEERALECFVSLGELFEDFSKELQQTFDQFFQTFVEKQVSLEYLIGGRPNIPRLRERLGLQFPDLFSVSQALKDPIKEIQQYMAAHFREELSVAMLARRYGFSPNYLSSLFHQKTGYTFIEYLTFLRLAKARLLLREGHSVKETAWEVGYRDEKYFARLYREHFGVVPSEEKDAAGKSERLKKLTVNNG
ncbi:helix-turn-helix domain-containing protein [Treponema sp. J25]|uniref:helix-turn-helix domain-containing protein n=1 Tax=Treponema sp. J25 TaxID=2094121 RepID=UPI001053C748|nr:helix-turn-helix domain-containing protein [Treponema sp. J25]TCW61120.1 hypothetical protein C5O22_07660 [Treponema sp. J25]